MKKIGILGVTGSIGSSALKIVKKYKSQFKISYISSHTNYKKTLSIAKEFGIDTAVFTGYVDKKSCLCSDINCYFGANELEKVISSTDVDIILNAVAGSSGLRYTIKAIENGIDLALANKESMVMAGDLINNMLNRSKTKIIPVDSEHSAIFQLLEKTTRAHVKRIFITASGGPFFKLDSNQFEKITPEKALNHPTWSMGQKITIDSATMLNKALEVIEAHYLFKVGYKQIEAVIHPQSIVHSIVEFIDGTFFAQMSEPSMQLPILYAFTYPKRGKGIGIKSNIFKFDNLTFNKIEKKKYPLFFLGVWAGKEGGIFPTVLNAANEAAVKLFLEEKIGFTKIAYLVEKALLNFKKIDNLDIKTIYSVNNEVYNKLYKNNT